MVSLRLVGRALVAGMVLNTMLLPIPAAFAETMTPSAAPCPQTFLERPPGGRSILTASDRSGRFQAGVFSTAADDYRLTWWQNGVPMVGPRMPTGVNVTGVNSSGTVVGYGLPRMEWAAWLYRTGTARMVALPAPGHFLAETEAHAINDDGWVVGGWHELDASIDHVRPVIWSPEISVAELPMPAGYAFGVATGVDADGTPVGHVYNMDDTHMFVDWRPIVWLGDERTPVLLSGVDAEDYLFGKEVSGRGRVVAMVSDRLLQWHISNLDQPSVLMTNVMYVDDVNAKGSVVVTRYGSRPALYQNGELRPLEDSDTSSPPKVLTDDDVVYGNGFGPARWDCRS